MAKVKLFGDTLTGNLNQAWRAKILLNRATSIHPQDTRGGLLSNPGKDPGKGETIYTSQLKQKNTLERIKSSASNKVTNTQVISTITNDIILVNPTLSPAQTIIIQGKPKVLNMQTESTFAAIRSNMRNNPFYHFTGSEDTIQFDISWFSIEKDRKDVISNCRLLESWTKADGYIKAPPILYLQWGSSGMFDDDEFILVSAPYELSNFQNACMRDGEQEDLHLFPNLATQSLTLKRVTKNNKTHQEIMGTVSKTNKYNPI